MHLFFCVSALVIEHCVAHVDDLKKDHLLVPKTEDQPFDPDKLLNGV